MADEELLGVCSILLLLLLFLLVLENFLWQGFFGFFRGCVIIKFGINLFDSFL